MAKNGLKATTGHFLHSTTIHGLPAEVDVVAGVDLTAVVVPGDEKERAEVYTILAREKTKKLASSKPGPTDNTAVQTVAAN